MNEFEMKTGAASDRLDFEVEFKGLTEQGEFEGYASTFGNMDLGRDIVERGAFAKSIGKRGPRGIKMFADHSPSQRPGVWTAIAEDSKGLHVKGRLLLEKQVGRDAYIDMKEGVIDAMSIGYRTVVATYDSQKKVRTLKEVDLMEISILPFPMNEKARITQVKSITSIREFEEFLRDAGGFSHAAARAIAAGGFKAAEPRDEDGPTLGDEVDRLLSIMKKG